MKVRCGDRGIGTLCKCVETAPHTIHRCRCGWRWTYDAKVKTRVPPVAPR